MNAIRLIFFAVLLSATWPCLADVTDIIWEQHINDKLLQYIEPESVVWGETEDIRFLGLFTEQSVEQQAGNAVILLHTMGAHPDWPGIIRALRLQLSKHGWSTLSIQLPLLSPQKPLAHYGQTLADAENRIQTAITLLRDKGITNIAIIGHGFGAVAAALLLSDNPQLKITAFIGIGMHSPLFLAPSIDLQKELERLRLPVLELFGSQDYIWVLTQASQRKHISKKKHSYKQVVVEGADHFFTGLEPVLVSYIRRWLEQYRMIRPDDSDQGTGGV